jgi:tol-pal system protein YbgF
VLQRLMATAAVVLIVTPAWAANKDIERLQVQISTLQIQISDLQRVNQESQREIRRLVETLAEQTSLFRHTMQEQRMQGEAIQTALRETTERLSELGERFQALEAAQRALLPPPTPYVAAAETSGSAPAETPGASTAPPPPRELYSQAYTDYARGNFDLAIQGFREYLKHYPDTDFSDNAQYWIGECLYGQQSYSEATDAWNDLLRDFPASDKLPDARVKKGMALEKLGRRSQALLEYRYVVERYPNSPAARIAREKLNPQ